MVIEVCRWGLLGWTLVFFGGVAFFGCVAIAAELVGLHSVSLSVGPVGLMSSWSGPSGYGFQTEWGVGAMAYAGGVVGVIVGLRNDRRHMRAIRDR
jgi:hypothetical protein